MRFSSTKLFTDTHEWVSINNGVATVGITHYAQDALGKVVFVQLPTVGDSVTAGSDFAEVESVKASGRVYSPVNGTVSAVNDALTSEPVLINESPEEKGWIAKFSNATAPNKLMNEAEYKKFLESKH
jgi:glycine cleavage system H protein